MAPPVTPRNSLGDAQIELDAQPDHFREIDRQLQAFDAFFDTFYHECRRHLAEANLNRRHAIKSISQAQARLVDERDALVEVGPVPAGLAV